MEETIKKRRVILASVLKPVNDPRMLEKIGGSLEQRYEVHIVGQPGNNDYNTNIFLHPLTSFSRLSLARLAAPLNILKKVIALRPALLIICTHELLSVAILARLLIRCKVIYDVQENYLQNVYYGTAFPFILRPAVAGFVRAMEWMSSPFINYYFLAEKSYQHELGFTKGKRVVIENKFKKMESGIPDKMSQHDGYIHLLFSGTIAETTGVFNSIKVATALHQVEPRIRMRIIGFCPLQKTLAQVKREISSSPFITLTGGDKFVPHPDILSAIRSADYGFIAYPPNASTVNAIPTKLFEYLACQLPIILIDHPPWTTYCEPYTAAIPFDPEKIDAHKIMDEIRTKAFFTTRPEDVYWDSEEKKLETVLQTLLP